MCWVSHKGEGADLAMTSHSDDLEQALQENLKLRGELAIEVAKSKDLSRQRIRRDFHRLGLIFALIAGTVRIMFIAHDVVTLRLWEVTYGDLPVVVFGALVGLVEVTAVSLAVYGLIRAIGWVTSRRLRFGKSRSRTLSRMLASAGAFFHRFRS